MRRVSLASVFVASLVVVPLGAGVEDAPLDQQRGALARHLDTAVAHMDLGMRSPQYRESIEFLQEHAPDAIAEVSVVLLEEPGSFRKWQVTYLIGEFGDESALPLLRGLLDAPLPEPRPSHETEHAIDLQHAEEVTSRFQAVMSTAQLASHRPHLRDQVVSSLIDIAHEIPMTTSAAIYQLRKLLGPELEALRYNFPPEHAHEFDRFIPPPEWQGLLARGMQERDQREREARERQLPLCRLD